MKLFFSQPEFDGQLLRALAYTSSGGADIAECFVTAAKIKDGDFDSWYEEWCEVADRLINEADESFKKGHLVSASNSYLRASNYYRTAYFFLAGSPVDPRLLQAYDKHVKAFEAGIKLIPNKVESVQIPYQNTFLPAHFYYASNDGLPRPTIITFPGYDGTRQECYLSTARDALKRGFHVLCLDGPGQGETLIRNNIYMTPDWNLVVGGAIDHLQRYPEIDKKSLCLIGVSWGGMLAPLAACKEHRLAAVVASPGQYEALQGLKRALPQVEELIHENDFSVLDAILKQIVADKMTAAKFKYKMWVHGVETASDLLKEWMRYSLNGIASEIKTPTLILDYENESFSAGQAKELFDALTCSKTYILCKNSEGAGEHCGLGALSLINQRIYDWLEDLLTPHSQNN